MNPETGPDQEMIIELLSAVGLERAKEALRRAGIPFETTICPQRWEPELWWPVFVSESDSARAIDALKAAEIESGPALPVPTQFVEGPDVFSWMKPIIRIIYLGSAVLLAAYCIHWLLSSL